MKIEQSVIDAAKNVSEGCLSGLVYAKPEELAQAVISSYLKTIWHEFDKDNPETWPKTDKRYLLKYTFKDDVAVDADEWHKSLAPINGWSLEYCDPADIMFKEIE
jgi:hypothetical protein